jgi:hypothetical protein
MYVLWSANFSNSALTLIPVLTDFEFLYITHQPHTSEMQIIKPVFGWSPDSRQMAHNESLCLGSSIRTMIYVTMFVNLCCKVGTRNTIVGIALLMAIVSCSTWYILGSQATAQAQNSMHLYSLWSRVQYLSNRIPY